MSERSIEKIILNNFPSFIAKRYQSLMEKLDSEESSSKSITDLATHIYEISTRALALFLVSQYLIKDKNDFQSDELSKILSKSILSPIYLRGWKNIVMTAMKAYKGHSDKLYIEELHDVFWEYKEGEYVEKEEAKQVFDKMENLWADMKEESEPLPISVQKRQKKAENTVEHLNNFLGQFIFIKNYAVIRITKRGDAGYQYEDLTGLEKRIASDTISAAMSLRIGWYYLYSRQPNSKPFLLHPLLVFLSSFVDHDDQDMIKPIGFLDHFTGGECFFWDPGKGETITVKREDLLATIIDCIYIANKRLKGHKRESSRLNWKNLVKFSQEVTDSSMASYKTKYDKDKAYYLQRETVVKTFVDFIDSDKTVLILTGKSGVGKTSFVLSLLDKFQRDLNICFLTLYGHGLELEAGNLKELNRRFSEEFKYDLPAEANIDYFLDKIKDIPGMQDNMFIIIVDAINESPKAINLLKNINKLVVEIGPKQSWFKIVITSRPETWRVIYQGAKPLSINRYFRPGGQHNLDVEIPEFQNIVVKIDRFSRSEVNKAFEKYRGKFDIKSRFEELTPFVRAAIRDPLMMRLTALTYSKKKIPSKFSTNYIYRKYVDRLIEKHEMFQWEDADFLEKEIVPRMVKADYANEINVDAEEDSFKYWILRRERDSQGKLISQSFQNLVDADILYLEKVEDLEKLETRQLIRFKFERFFDFYIGQYLYRESIKESDGSKYFKALAERIKEKPYLWGAVKHALLEYLIVRSKDKQNINRFLISIARQAEEQVKELLISTLVDFYNEKPEPAIKALLYLTDKTQLDASRPRLTSDEKNHIKVIAVEAAYRSVEAGIHLVDSYKKIRNLESILIIFRRILEDRTEAVRDTGLTFLQLMTDTMPDFVNEVAESIKNKIIKNLTPSKMFHMLLKMQLNNLLNLLNLLRSFAMFSLFFVAKRIANEAYVEQTLVRFGLILKHILMPETVALKMLRPLINFFLIRVLATKQHIKWKRDTDTLSNYWEIALWLDPQRSACKREDIERIVSFYNPTEKPIAENRDEFIELCRKKSGVIPFFMGTAIAFHYSKADNQDDPSRRTQEVKKITEIIEALCNDEEDSDIAKLTALHALPTIIIINLKQRGDEEREKLKKLFLETAFSYIKEKGGWSQIEDPEDISLPRKFKVFRKVKPRKRSWNNDILTNYCLVRYESTEDLEEEKGFPIMAEILRPSTNEDIVKNFELICCALSTLGGLGMAQRAIYESHNLIEEFIIGRNLNKESESKVKELMVDSLLQLKGCSSSRVEHLIEYFDTSVDKYKFLDEVKTNSARHKTLSNTMQILGDYVYQYGFNKFDGMADAFSKAILEATKETHPRKFFNVCHDYLLNWAEKEIREHL